MYLYLYHCDTLKNFKPMILLILAPIALIALTVNLVLKTRRNKRIRFNDLHRPLYESIVREANYQKR